MFRFASFLLALVFAVACSKEEPKAPTGPTYPHADDPAIGKLVEFIKSQDVTTGGERIDKSREGWRSFLPKPPQVEFTAGKTYVWRMETSHGPLNVKLFTAQAPMHASSFLYLTMLGYFDGLGFHRVIKQFMAQGGCPRGEGTGDPGYSLDLEIAPDLKHDRPFIVSTANAGPGTDGSQFFVMFKAYPSLDGGYSIFGELLDEDSKTTARAMELVGNPGDGPPTEPIKIVKATYSVE